MLARHFFEIHEDMVHIQLMLEALFTQDSKADDLFCRPALISACSSAIISLAWG